MAASFDFDPVHLAFLYSKYCGEKQKERGEEKSISLAVDWSEMNPELLDLIIKRLDLVAFIRAGAVCRSWRSAMDTSTYISPPNSHTPWLLLCPPNQPEHLYVNNPADPKSMYKFNLHDVKHHVLVGSSHGFIISADEIAQVHATNPVTGSHKLLPAVTSLLCCAGAVRDPATNRISSYLIGEAPEQIDFSVQNLRKFLYSKVALFSTSSAGLISVIIHNWFNELAFACESDESWTTIESPIINFQDVVFYKGLLYAVNREGCLIAFDILNFSTSSRPVIYVEGWTITERFGSCYVKRYLVQSPCASDLFLIVRSIGFYSPMGTIDFKIYKLNQDIYEWSEVSSFGTDPVVVFLDCNQSVMLLAKDIPSVAVNTGDYIYFTDDLQPCLHTKQNIADMGIFCMEDKKITHLYINDDDLQRFCFPLPFWFTPVNK